MKTPAWAILAILVAVPSWAADNDSDQELPIETQLKNAHCGEQILASLGEWESRREWVQAAPTMDGARVFRTPTQKVGTWLEVTVFPDGRINTAKMSAEMYARVDWFADDCAPKIAVSTNKYDKKRMAKAFTDAELAKEIQENKSGLIYAWSPHMPLSIQGYELARKAAEKAKVRFIPVLDPYAEGRKVASDGGGKKGKAIESLDLLLRGMTIHFPSALVFHNGRITSRLLPGLAAGEGYDQFIKENTR
jgi:hypothetical protein